MPLSFREVRLLQLQLTRDLNQITARATPRGEHVAAAAAILAGMNAIQMAHFLPERVLHQTKEPTISQCHPLRTFHAAHVLSLGIDFLAVLFSVLAMKHEGEERCQKTRFHAISATIAHQACFPNASANGRSLFAQSIRYDRCRIKSQWLASACHHRTFCAGMVILGLLSMPLSALGLFSDSDLRDGLLSECEARDFGEGPGDVARLLLPIEIATIATDHTCQLTLIPFICNARTTFRCGGAKICSHCTGSASAQEKSCRCNGWC